jgi:hypothetical protein
VVHGHLTAGSCLTCLYGILHVIIVFTETSHCTASRPTSIQYTFVHVYARIYICTPCLFKIRFNFNIPPAHGSYLTFRFSNSKIYFRLLGFFPCPLCSPLPASFIWSLQKYYLKNAVYGVPHFAFHFHSILTSSLLGLDIFLRIKRKHRTS